MAKDGEEVSHESTKDTKRTSREPRMDTDEHGWLERGTKNEERGTKVIHRFHRLHRFPARTREPQNPGTRGSDNRQDAKNAKAKEEMAKCE
jgi:hypothetical protein